MRDLKKKIFGLELFQDMREIVFFEIEGKADLPTSMKFRNSSRIFLPITEKSLNYGFFFL